MSQRVCIPTFSRSDYASLRPVIRAVQVDSAIDLIVIAGGSHCLNRFGHSIDKIIDDGIEINHTIEFLHENDDSNTDLAWPYERAYSGLVKSLVSEKPDCVFILGDRWEMLVLASAASMLNIPIIHHSGGDITQGSQDNQTRYAISVLSHIHLVALEEHRQRLITMGEEPWRVVTTGEPALTELDERVARVTDVRYELGLDEHSRFVLATFHPTSYDTVDIPQQVDLFIDALCSIKEHIILTAPNPDPGSQIILEKLRGFAESKTTIHLFENLGSDCYYAAMKNAEFMIGNSSSGIWEAPSFGLAVINIGERQRDRLRGDNVINVPLDTNAIKQALTEIPLLKSKLKGKTIIKEALIYSRIER